ncbi:MAG TPA: hypothetical protein VHM88_05750 [Candidatus Acidoferrales bacterium]|nr:hypothetical protein [Candidatus Acidoferrales bacterium]
MRTASIIARIAATLAKSPWRITVTAEVGRIELKLSNDHRLAAGVAGAVAHVAERVGFDAGAQAGLVEATEEACRDAFLSLGNATAQLGVSIEDFPDRVEVTLEYQTPREAEATAGRGGHKLLARVDSVRRDTQAGVSRMTLVKYIHPHAQRP